MSTGGLYIGLILACTILLAGCSGTKEALGLNKQAPDEFRVVKRAPLALPPDYTLRPPQPGAQRPQELRTDQAARQAVFGDAAEDSAQRTNPAVSSEILLLMKAGTDAKDPDIRAKVDSETSALHDRNKPVAERLLGIGGDANEPSATVVDSKAEAARIKENLEAGKAVTDGDTPYLEQ